MPLNERFSSQQTYPTQILITAAYLLAVKNLFHYLIKERTFYNSKSASTNKDYLIPVTAGTIIKTEAESASIGFYILTINNDS